MFVTLIGMVIYYYLARLPEKNSAFAVFPTANHTVGPNQEWELRLFQPILTGFSTQDSKNYLNVEYRDNQNKKHKLRVFVTGKAEGEKVIKEVGFASREQGGLKDFEFLKINLKLGRQIQIEYLAHSPEFAARSLSDCQTYLNFCDLALMADANKEELTTFASDHQASDKLILMATAVSTDLIK